MSRPKKMCELHPEERKDRCKSCGNGLCLCGSGKRSDKCTICKPVIKCMHNVVKVNCIECHPEKKCLKHGGLKTSCRQCKKRSCEHSNNKDTCKICHVDSLCKHGNIGHRCNPCKKEKKENINLIAF